VGLTSQKSDFKPYTLRDYHSKFQTSGENYSFLGGLGPNKDEKWQKAMDNLKKRRYFGSAVKQKNELNPTTKLFRLLKYKKEMACKNNARFRALEFAKTIKR